MSSDGRYHKSSCNCRKRGHTVGKWCWSEADIESLEKQYAEGKTWNQIADSFKFYNAAGDRTCYRHHSIACHKKMSLLLLDVAEQTKSRGVASLDKSPGSVKCPTFDNPFEKQVTAGAKDKRGSEDSGDDEKVEEAIEKAVIKLEYISE